MLEHKNIYNLDIYTLLFYIYILEIILVFVFSNFKNDIILIFIIIFNLFI
jgi:hypothetical protein